MNAVEFNAFIAMSDETGDGDRVAVKDLVDVRGMVTTAGGIILPKTPAGEDAPVIEQSKTCFRHGSVNPIGYGKSGRGAVAWQAERVGI